MEQHGTQQAQGTNKKSCFCLEIVWSKILVNA